MIGLPDNECALAGKRLLIFDFDGTIADTSPLHAAAFEKVLAPLGIRVDYREIAGMKTADAVNLCLKSSRVQLEPDGEAMLVQDKQQLVRNLIEKQLCAFPGVDEFLCWARGRYQLAMVTSGSRGTVHLALAKLGYRGWFNPFVCADDLQKGKPDPEGYLKVLQSVGVPADQALVFEDSKAGFEAAVAAGLSYIDVSSLNWFDLKKRGENTYGY